MKVIPSMFLSNLLSTFIFDLAFDSAHRNSTVTEGFRRTIFDELNTTNTQRMIAISEYKNKPIN